MGEYHIVHNWLPLGSGIAEPDLSFNFKLSSKSRNR
jgi:hypothetical protein